MRIHHNFVTTTASEKDRISEQWARVFYRNRLPFSLAEDNEFKTALNMMRPGIGDKLMTRKDLAGKYLTKEHSKIDMEMRSALEVLISPI